MILAYDNYSVFMNIPKPKNRNTGERSSPSLVPRFPGSSPIFLVQYAGEEPGNEAKVLQQLGCNWGGGTVMKAINSWR